MSDEKEPGIFDVLASFLEGDSGESSWACEVCNNGKARLMVRCPCGWKVDVCLACLALEPSRDSFAIADQVKEHVSECDALSKLVRMSKVARGD